jgi:serine/threonine protein kinase
LDNVIGDGLDEDAAKFYAAGILEGLMYMYRRHDCRHIIHRDLKPQNAMVDNLGYPVLIDLGFGKSILLVAKDGFRAGSHHFCIASSKICPGQNLHMLQCTWHRSSSTLQVVASAVAWALIIGAGCPWCMKW